MSDTAFGVRTERWPAKEVLRITGHSFSGFDLVVVQIGRDGRIGQGEALGVYYLGDTAESVMTGVESVRDAIAQGAGRRELLQLLPAGGARHAVDSALWDLECKLSGVRCWPRAGTEPRALQAQLTLGIEESAEATGRQAARLSDFPHLKLKVDANDPMSRVRAVRRARPDARLVVDANQAWSFEDLLAHAEELAALGVYMVEQPLARGHDDKLSGYRCPVPLCADESCLDETELPLASERYQFLNIKLDKVGGLTAGLALARRARDLGMRLMVGCMGGTSLSMAPAHVLACAGPCEIADLDGPLWLRSDRLPSIEYTNGLMAPFGPEVWG